MSQDQRSVQNAARSRPLVRRKARIESIGVYVPDRVLSTAELVGRMAVEPAFDLEALTGIAKRRVRAQSEDSYGLALKAAQNCLSRSRLAAEDLDALIYVSITRFKGELISQYEPALSLYLKKRLGAQRALNFDLANACAGMCSGMHVLDSMIRSGAVRNGLIVSGECITPIAEVALQEITESDDRQVASLTVGDAGSACILEQCALHEPGIDFIRLLTLSEFSELCMAMPSDQRPGVAMYTKSVKLHIESIKRFPRMMATVLEEHGMNLSDYALLIPHQTSAHAIRTGAEAVSRCFQQERELFSVVPEYGNTSSTSHFVALNAAIAEKKAKQGDRVLLLVMASGLVLGFVSFTLGFLEASHAHENRFRQRMQPSWSGLVD